MQIGFEFEAAVPKRLRAAEEQPAQQSMRGDRKITQAPSTDQKKVRREMARKTADIQVTAATDLQMEAALYGDNASSSTHCPDCGANREEQNTTGWHGLGPGMAPHFKWRCGDCGHHYDAPLSKQHPMYENIKGRMHADEIAKNRSFHDSHEPRYPRHGSAGDVEEHDDVNAKDEFNSEHVEPNGGHHHHKSRTAAMDYTALMNDVGDCRSCGGNLVRQPGEKGASTVTAQCEDCGMEHQLQERHQQTAAVGQRTARQEQHLLAVQAMYEVDHTPCPDCGSKGWNTKDNYGHKGGHTDGKFQMHWMVKCKDCGHKYDVPRDDHAEDRAKRQRYASLSWEPSPGRYLPNPHQHMSAIARRAQSVLDQKENQ